LNDLFWAKVKFGKLKNNVMAKATKNACIGLPPQSIRLNLG
jgi:hypothetical protein